MGVAMVPGSEYEKVVAFSYVAEWQYKDAVPSTDAAATPFGPPPWRMRQGLIRASQPPGPQMMFYKPVDYVPVKRTNGTDKLPTLILSIRLSGAGMTSNAKVPSWVGTPVDVEVVNVLRGLGDGPDGRSGDPKAKLTLHGKLDSNLTCNIEIKTSDLQGWLKLTSPLNALVNENLFDFRFKLNGVTEDDGSPVQGQSRNRVFLYCRKTIVFLPGLFGSQVQFTLPSGEVVGFPDFWNERARAIGEAVSNVPGLGPLVNIGTQIPDMRFQHADVLECDDKGIPLIPCPKPTLLMLHGLRFVGFDVINPFTSCHAARMAMLPDVPENFRLYTLIIYPYDWRADLTDAAAGLIKHLTELRDGPAADALGKAPDTDDRVTVMGHSTGGVVIRRALATIDASECTGSDPAVQNFGRPSADTLINFAFFLSVPFSGAPKAGAVLMTGLDAPQGNRQIPVLIPDSLVAVSLSMPIVYHLHTSGKYNHRPSTSPSRPPGQPRDAEADKAAFVRDVLAAGLMPTPWLVRADVATAPDQRLRLAVQAQKWHQLINELHQRVGGVSLLHAVSQSWTHVNWFQNEINARGLQEQQSVRKPGGWVPYLAARAKAFHDKSEKAVTGVWNQRTAIFWGSCQKSVTLRQLNLSKVGEQTFADVLAYAAARGIRALDLGDIKSQPRVTRQDKPPFRGGSEDVVQWTLGTDNKQVTETTWRLGWVQQLSAGDGTVPADSQLAEEKTVKANLLTTATAADEAPVHMDSTKSDRVWRTLLSSIHHDQIETPADGETQFMMKTDGAMAYTTGVPELPFFEPP
jgi:hypothetical protein